MSEYDFVRTNLTSIHQIIEAKNFAVGAIQYIHHCQHLHWQSLNRLKYLQINIHFIYCVADTIHEINKNIGKMKSSARISEVKVKVCVRLCMCCCCCCGKKIKLQKPNVNNEFAFIAEIFLKVFPSLNHKWLITHIDGFLYATFIHSPIKSQ